MAKSALVHPTSASRSCTHNPKLDLPHSTCMWLARRRRAYLNCLSVEVAPDHASSGNDRRPLSPRQPVKILKDGVLASPCRHLSVEQDRTSHAPLIECIASRLSCMQGECTPPRCAQDTAATAYQRRLICPLSMGFDHAVCAARSPSLNRNWLEYGRNFPHAVSSSTANAGRVG